MNRRKEIEGQLSLFDMPMNADTYESNTVECVPGNVDCEDGKTVRDPEGTAHAPEQSVCESEGMTCAPGGFAACQDCWCYTCEHSTVGGSKPRPFAEGERPCPACELCVKAGKADICVIGSAREGCSFRAKKEGIEAGETYF